MLPGAALGSWIPRLARIPASARQELPGITPDRTFQIVAAAVVLHAAMQALDVDELEVSPVGAARGRAAAIHRVAVVERPSRVGGSSANGDPKLSPEREVVDHEVNPLAGRVVDDLELREPVRATPVPLWTARSAAPHSTHGRSPSVDPHARPAHPGLPELHTPRTGARARGGACRDRVAPSRTGHVRARGAPAPAPVAVPRISGAERHLRRPVLAELRLGRARREGVGARGRVPPVRPAAAPHLHQASRTRARSAAGRAAGPHPGRRHSSYRGFETPAELARAARRRHRDASGRPLRRVARRDAEARPGSVLGIPAPFTRLVGRSDEQQRAAGRCSARRGCASSRSWVRAASESPGSRSRSPRRSRRPGARSPSPRWRR